MYGEGTLSMIGLASVLYALARLLIGTVSYFYIYFTRTNFNLRSGGDWAVVTGATNGIGKGIAFELAKRKMNILLISRDPEKLKRVSNEIETKYLVKTKSVAIDLSLFDETTSSSYDAIENVSKSLEIGVLVNNAGMGASGEFLKAFSKSENKDISSGIPRLVYCNDLSMAMITAKILPQMRRHGKGGLVVNISSLAASVIMPKHAIYSASKKFNDTFTKCLREENKGSGITFQSIQPGKVSTSMTSNAKVSYGTPSSEMFAAHAVETFGKNVVTTGYHYHAILRLVVSSLPDFLVSKILMRQ